MPRRSKHHLQTGHTRRELFVINRYLFEIVESPRSIYEWQQGEPNVALAVGPPDLDWYLRFYAHWNASNSELQGKWDITLPESKIENFRQTTLPHLACEILEGQAETYFQLLSS